MDCIWLRRLKQVSFFCVWWKTVECACRAICHGPDVGVHCCPWSCSFLHRLLCEIVCCNAGPWIVGTVKWNSYYKLCCGMIKCMFAVLKHVLLTLLCVHFVCLSSSHGADWWEEGYCRWGDQPGHGGSSHHGYVSPHVWLTFCVAWVRDVFLVFYSHRVIGSWTISGSHALPAGLKLRFGVLSACASVVWLTLKVFVCLFV